MNLGPRAWTAVLLALAASACAEDPPPATRILPPRAPAPAAPSFIGRAACAGCHADALAAWTGSDHDRAMDPATEATVLGDFADASLAQFGVTTRFLRKDGKFLVRTEGPDGKLEDFEVAFVFGVHPLQQYLVKFPDGRMQALPFCWDTRPKAEGGRRWFHIYPGERIPPGDLLFWTRGAQNWNHMCADCHSTDLRKNYSAGTFATSWKEIDVSCEACHGPGSAHASWGQDARAGKPVGDDPATGLLVRLRDRGEEKWVIDPKTGTAVRSRPSGEDMEVETCARCHARSSVIAEEFKVGAPLLDSRMPTVLEENLYFPDGQIREEVYEYGSFLQSRMHRMGVSCRDCHDPHTLKLRAPGNATCATCHDPARFDAPAHHRHEAGTEGASCVACHMPTRTYMVVDPRRDHSIRVPRPDLTRSIGSPNACNSVACHADRDAAWAQAAVEKWYPAGRWKSRHWGTALEAGRRNLPGAGDLLEAAARDPEVPGIARATAVELLGTLAGTAAGRAIPLAAKDADPLVRAMAGRAARGLPVPDRAPVLAGLFTDPVRGVRIEAGRSFADLLTADVPAGLMTAAARAAGEAALREWRVSQEVNADRPEAHLNLGVVAAQAGEFAAAEAAYRRALALEPLLPGGWLNLADLLRARADDAGAEKTLREGLRFAGTDPALLHSLGLTLVRLQRRGEAVAPLEEAARLEPGNARYALTHALIVDATGGRSEAIRILEDAQARVPGDRDLLVTLVSLHQEAGNEAAARHYGELLGRLGGGR